jgi:hypothetical protein
MWIESYTLIYSDEMNLPGIWWVVWFWLSLVIGGSAVVCSREEILNGIAEFIDDLKVRKRDGKTKDDEHAGTADEPGRGCGKTGQAQAGL